jgi:hypothetical protein
LCHKIGKFHINSLILKDISSIVGEAKTSSSNIFVMFEISSGIGISG